MDYERLNVITENIEKDDINHIEALTSHIEMIECLIIYNRIIQPIRECNPGSYKMLHKLVKELKQTDGEHWAIGEMLERTLQLLGKNHE